MKEVALSISVIRLFSILAVETDVNQNLGPVLPASQRLVFRPIVIPLPEWCPADIPGA
jgi:hypothetical protein